MATPIEPGALVWVPYFNGEGIIEGWSKYDGFVEYDVKMTSGIFRGQFVSAENVREIGGGK